MGCIASLDTPEPEMPLVTYTTAQQKKVHGISNADSAPSDITPQDKFLRHVGCDEFCVWVAFQVEAVSMGKTAKASLRFTHPIF